MITSIQVHFDNASINENNLDILLEVLKNRINEVLVWGVDGTYKQPILFDGGTADITISAYPVETTG